MRDTLPLLEKIPFPALRRGRARHLADQCRLSLQPVLRALPRQCRPEPHRGNERRGRRHRARRSSSGGGSRRSTSPAARRSSTRISAAWSRRARAMGVTRDGPLQSHDPRSSRAGGPRRNFSPASRSRSSPRCRAICEDNVDRQRGKGVFDGSIRGLQRLNALGYGREAPGSCSTSSTIRKGLRCRRRRPRWRPTTSACSASSYGIAFNSLFTLANMPIQRFGSMLVSQGRVRRLSRAAAARASRRQSRRRDVPQPDLGRLARLSSTTATSTRCSTCRCTRGSASALHLSELIDDDLDGNPIRVAGHCYRLHRRPGLELRRRAEGGGGVTPRAGRAAAARRPDVSARLPSIRPRCSTARPNRRPTRSTSSAGCTAISRRSKPIERLAAPSRRRRTIVFNGDFHWFDAEPAGLPRSNAASRPTRRCAATSRPRSRAPTTSARAAAAPIRSRVDAAWCALERNSARAARDRRCRARARGSARCRCTRRAGRRRSRRHRPRRRERRSPAGASPAMNSAGRQRLGWLDDIRRAAQVDVFASTHTCSLRLRDFALPAGRLPSSTTARPGMPNLPAQASASLPRRHHALAAPALYGLAATASHRRAGGGLRHATLPQRFLRAGRRARPAHNPTSGASPAGPDYDLRAGASRA